ncbi:unnamed protein product, partial [Rotaria sp. Silwood2]
MTEKCIEWFWKSNDNPFSTMESAQWNRYSDIENTIIEEAFTTLKKAYVILDDYHIDFEHRVQISNDDKSKQRPVKRVEINKDEGRLREARFMPNPLVSTNWENRKREMVEKAILGILHEGKLAGKQCEAKWIIQ